MSEYHLSTQPFQEWDAHELAEYIRSKGLADYCETFESNNVSGAVAHRLTDSDLKDMGITKVGDRLLLMQALETVKKAQKQLDREKVIWEGTEVLYFSCYDQNCSTCCGCCPDDPSEYKLRSNQLEIKTVDPCRVGPIRCCCFSSYQIDNVDLSGIQSADVEGVPPGCFHQICCGAPQEHIHVLTSGEGEKILKLKQDEGQEVARKIKNQVEAMQRMERS
eukprot:CAMPEP_0202449310 /NCGR_PEP_ID=MMETSP1360-20130828/8049_1 /ASSEMBLY_ACC=CAM_ASM_000848 /TAXON_ID=515479 /ORGANISM="Licmophora paradoxa, Strain CCMP2313" /LENGTH=219 /DNA_ID=CAMNT_0049067189 /DNA_START=20 /DNA_END=679 /DNA_ORIENTATION=-